MLQNKKIKRRLYIQVIINETKYINLNDDEYTIKKKEIVFIASEMYRSLSLVIPGNTLHNVVHISTEVIKHFNNKGNMIGSIFSLNDLSYEATMYMLVGIVPDQPS